LILFEQSADYNGRIELDFLDDETSMISTVLFTAATLSPHSNWFWLDATGLLVSDVTTACCASARQPSKSVAVI